MDHEMSTTLHKLHSGGSTQLRLVTRTIDLGATSTLVGWHPPERVEKEGERRSTSPDHKMGSIVSLLAVTDLVKGSCFTLLHYSL